MFIEEVIQLKVTESNKMSAKEKSWCLYQNKKLTTPDLQNPHKFPDSNPELFGSRKSQKFTLSQRVPSISNQDLDDRDPDGENGDLKNAFTESEQIDLQVATESKLPVPCVKQKSLSDVESVCEGRMSKEQPELEESKE